MAGGATFHPKLLVDGKRPFDKYAPASEMIPNVILKYLKAPLVPTTFTVMSWPLYKVLASQCRNNGWGEAKFCTVVFCTLITATWVFFTGFYAAIEYMHWFERYKIDRQSPQLGSWKLVFATLKEVIIGKLFVAPLSVYMIGTEVLKRRGILHRSYDLEMPPVHQLWLEFLIAIVFNEVGFYWAHRTLHCSFLYAKIHKKHHEWKGTVSYAAEYAHPVEQFFANYIPTLGGCLLTGAHPWTFIVWTCERLRLTYEGHSGYALDVHPILDALNITNPSVAAEHDFHHTCNSGNFGSQWMDWLFGTMDSWVVAGGEEGYLKTTKKEKLSYMHSCKTKVL